LLELKRLQGVNENLIPASAMEQLEILWEESRSLYARGHHALGAFLAITLFEEVGKVSGHRVGSIQGNVDAKLYSSHKRKRATAADLTSQIGEERMERYGENRDKFAEWVRSGELAKLRNQSLYLDQEDGEILAPQVAITPADAYLLICFAGETYAKDVGELGDEGVTLRARILEDLDQIRNPTPDAL